MARLGLRVYFFYWCVLIFVWHGFGLLSSWIWHAPILVLARPLGPALFYYLAMASILMWLGHYMASILLHMNPAFVRAWPLYGLRLAYYKSCVHYYDLAALIFLFGLHS